MRADSSQDPPHKAFPRFAAAAGVTAASVVVLGWMIDLQKLAFGSCALLMSIVLLPFLLFALRGLWFLLSGLLDLQGGSETDPSGLISFFETYYTLLSQRRLPVLRGVLVGLAVGSLANWGLMYAMVVSDDTEKPRSSSQPKGQGAAGSNARSVLPAAAGVASYGDFSRDSRGWRARLARDGRAAASEPREPLEESRWWRSADFASHRRS